MIGKTFRKKNKNVYLNWGNIFPFAIQECFPGPEGLTLSYMWLGFFRERRERQRIKQYSVYDMQNRIMRQENNLVNPASSLRQSPPFLYHLHSHNQVPVLFPGIQRFL